MENGSGGRLNDSQKSFFHIISQVSLVKYRSLEAKLAL
jgi:hypothetical protein